MDFYICGNYLRTAVAFCKRPEFWTHAHTRTHTHTHARKQPQTHTHTHTLTRTYCGTHSFLSVIIMATDNREQEKLLSFAGRVCNHPTYCFLSSGSKNNRQLQITKTTDSRITMKLVVSFTVVKSVNYWCALVSVHMIW